MIELLKAKGVTERIAKELVGKYPQERIMAQLKMLPYRSAQNPAGMLIKAIKENWALPKAYLSACGHARSEWRRSPAQRTEGRSGISQADQKLEEEKAIKRAEDERKAKKEARRKDRQQEMSEIKAKMFKQELQQLRERAKQKLTRVLRNVYGENNLPETLIKAEMDYIIKKEYLKGT